LTLNISREDERTGAHRPAAPPPGGAAVSANRTSQSAGAPLLAVDGVVIRFGGIVALDGVSFELAVGSILGLIGPNGAGKTSLFNCMTGLYVPQEGEVRFAGRNILGLAAHRIAALGITRTFQNLALFGTMSVLDNLRTGAHVRVASNFVTDALRIGAARRSAAIDEVADELIATFEIGDVVHRPVSVLPSGTQKRVELARALAGGPKLLLLDEPASGLNHTEVEHLGAMIRRIRDERGVTVLLVEHHMNLVMSISDKVVALDFGRKIAEGPPAAVRADPEVVRAYLGGAGR
jgi:branched-chain amino acid transport system ATP-binding protein